MQFITQAVNDFKSMLLSIAGAMAVIGLLGLGMMYTSSSIPLLKSWKEGNPKAFEHVVIGLIILTLVSSGAIASLLPSN